MRSTASLPSSPAASPVPVLPPPAAPSPRMVASASGRRGAVRKRAKNARSKLNLAGLVGGDSDSSALTQESGDEGGVAVTPMESVVTGTDAGTDYADDEDAEMREASPGTEGTELLWSFLPLTLIAREVSPRPMRGRPPKAGRRGRGGSTRGNSTRGQRTRKKK